MARRFGRRRFNGLWFPVLGGSELDETNVPYNGNANTVLYQVIAGDEPFNAASTAGVAYDAPGAIAIATRSGYSLKRIVGQLHIGLKQGAVPEGTGTVITAEIRAGLFVDRTDQDGVLQNEAAWNPFQEGAKQKRWLWQRSWILNNSEAPIAGFYDYPHTNAEYNGALSNGHVDWKGGARVSYEERLFLQVSGRALWVSTGMTTSDASMSACFNLRVLGKPMTRNNR